MQVFSSTTPLEFLQDLRFDAAKRGAGALGLDVLDAAIEIIERDDSEEMQAKIDDLEDDVRALKGELSKAEERIKALEGEIDAVSHGQP